MSDAIEELRGEYGPTHWQPMPYREPRNRPEPPKP